MLSYFFVPSVSGAVPQCVDGWLLSTAHILSPFSSTLLLRSALRQMDDASRVLMQGVPAGMPTSYRALADHSGVPRSTLHHRARGRRSIKEKAQSQQYLTPYEEDALVTFLLQMSDLRQPVRIKHIPSLAFVIARKRLRTHRPLKPPGKN